MAKGAKMQSPLPQTHPCFISQLELYRLTVYLQEICREWLLYMLGLQVRLYRGVLFHLLARLLWGCFINDLMYSQLYYIGMLMVSRL